MAYDEYLADCIRQVLNEKKVVNVIEKRMMGGLTFMVNDKMCVGIIKNELMARIDPEWHDEATALYHCRTMDFTAKPMIGYVMISPEGIDSSEDLEFWIERALLFNPKAKSSKKSSKNV